MRAREVTIGPVRSPYGLADVTFDGVRLRLQPVGNALEVLDRYALLLLAWCLVLLIAGGYADGPVATVLFVASGACFAALLLLGVVAAVTSAAAIGVGVVMVFTRRGRRAIRNAWRGRSRGRTDAIVLPEPEIRLMDNVYGAWRVHLVLHTDRGEVRLSAWRWRRFQLVRLQRALAA